MSISDKYRAQAAEYIRLARQASFISDIKEYLRRAQYLGALAESEEWLAANRDDIILIQATAGRQTGHRLAEALELSRESVAAQRSQGSATGDASRAGSFRGAGRPDHEVSPEPLLIASGT